MARASGDIVKRLDVRETYKRHKTRRNPAKIAKQTVGRGAFL
jgi:hypothetical protein